MKVYLATSGEYSDFRVRHVFARREDAESYELGDDVEEREVRDGPVEVRSWHRLYWHPGKPDADDGDSFALGNPWSSSRPSDFDGRARLVEHRWDDTAGGRVLTVEGWDLDGVRKVYSEQRAQHIAAQ
jgi:hypothetical protein